MASPQLPRGSPYDAIVVLGTTVLASGAPSAILERRLRTAADLFAAAASQTVVVSGGRRWGRYVEAEVMKQRLRELGVDERAIVAELFSLNTVDNAFFCAQHLGELGLKRVAVVTSHWHMPRAMRHFRALGVDAHPVAAARREEPRQTSRSEKLGMGLRELVAAGVYGFWAHRARSATMGGG